MTNVQAAVVNSQFGRLESTYMRKQEIFNIYASRLEGAKFQEIPEHGSHCWWMVSIRHDESGWYGKASNHLSTHGIETRPIFPPLHTMPACDSIDMNAPVAHKLTDTGITLPSGPGLTNDQIHYICDKVLETL